MTTKHTEGPWEHSAPMGEGDHAILSDKVTSYGNFYVATIPNGNHEQAEANAKLIAAAPDLLAAAVDLLAMLNIAFERCDGDLMGIHHNAAIDAMSNASKVIAKATT